VNQKVFQTAFKFFFKINDFVFFLKAFFGLFSELSTHPQKVGECCTTKYI